jgi:hypothetical protein
MPRNFWLFSIRHSTTIILVDTGGTLNMIQGDLRHIDRSTNFTNRDAFNIELENTVTEQPLPSTTSPGKVATIVLGLEAPRALIYNGYIQCLLSWYLQIPPPRVMNMI